MGSSNKNNKHVEFSNMAAHWDNGALTDAVNAFLSDSRNAISKEEAQVEELVRSDNDRTIRFYIDVEDPNNKQYASEVAKKLPRFRFQHKKVRIRDGSSGYVDLKFRTWLEFTPSLNPIVPLWQMILFLLCICLFTWSSYSLWSHWYNYDQPWKNLVPRLLEDFSSGLFA